MYTQRFKALACLKPQKLRVQLKMPINWPVKSNQVSRRVTCTWAEIRKGCDFKKKNVPKKILLIWWKFQIDISSDAEVIKKFCYNSFNSANPLPNTLEGSKSWNIARESNLRYKHFQTTVSLLNLNLNSNRMIYSLLRFSEKKIYSAKKVLMLSVEWFSDLSPSKVCLRTNQGTFASSFIFYLNLNYLSASSPYY